MDFLRRTIGLRAMLRRIDAGMSFHLKFRGKLFGDFELAATGSHNVLNALAAIAVAHGRGIPVDVLREALSTFRSVKRRMDVKGERDGDFDRR